MHTAMFFYPANRRGSQAPDPGPADRRNTSPRGLLVLRPSPFLLDWWRIRRPLWNGLPSRPQVSTGTVHGTPGWLRVGQISNCYSCSWFSRLVHNGPRRTDSCQRQRNGNNRVRRRQPIAQGRVAQPSSMDLAGCAVCVELPCAPSDINFVDLSVVLDSGGRAAFFDHGKEPRGRSHFFFSGHGPRMAEPASFRKCRRDSRPWLLVSALQILLMPPTCCLCWGQHSGEAPSSQ